MKTLVGAAVAFLLHWLLGWLWTILAGFLMGIWVGRRGWLLGGLAVGASWSVLIAYSLAVDPAAAGRMFDIMGSIFGGLPAFAVPVSTLLIGVLLGVTGGLFGTGIRNLWQ